MLVASLVLTAVLGQSAGSDPSDLVGRLGAPRFADRESAASRLERLGREAVPALLLARGQRDPEIRARAAALLNRIEGNLLTQPTLVRLDFADRPLVEVVKSISEQSGFDLLLFPGSDAAHWAGRRLTLREPSPIPFWPAIDRLCATALLQHNVALQGYTGGRESAVQLTDGGLRSTAPSFDCGPFRTSIVSIHLQRDVNYPMVPRQVPGDPRDPADLPRRDAAGDQTEPANHSRGGVLNEMFFAHMRVVAEPRLNLSQSGAVRNLEAIDEKGQLLVHRSRGGEATFQRNAGYGGFPSGSVVQFQAALSRPQNPGARIRMLEGVLPVVVSSRKPNPLLVSLADAAGKTFQNDEVALTVHEVRPRADATQTTIEISLAKGAGGSRWRQDTNSSPIDAGRTAFYQQQIEIADSQGRLIPWFQSNLDAESGRMTLTLTPAGATVVPASLRFYGLTRTATDVAFQFKDLPLP